MRNHKVFFCVMTLFAWAGLCAAQEPQPGAQNSRTAQIEQQIVATKALLAAATNDAERAQWTQKLELQKQDLQSVQKRMQLDAKEQTLTAELKRHAGVALRESLHAIDADVTGPNQEVVRLNKAIRGLRAERADLEAVRERLQQDAEDNAGRIADSDQGLRNFDEDILARTLERDAAELHVRLGKEAIRIDEMVKNLPVNPRPTVRLIVDKRRSIASEQKLVDDESSQIESIDQQRVDLAAALALTQEKLSHVDGELSLLEKKRQIDTNRGETRQLQYMAAADKKTLGLRIQSQQQQMVALAAMRGFAVQLHDLYQKECNFLKDDLATLMTRYRREFIWPVLVIAILIVGRFVLSRLIFPIIYKRESLFIARRMTGYLLALLIIMVFAVFFLEDIKQIATVLGIASAAVVIALQDLCSAFAGWFVIVGSRKFVVGDRVEVDGMRGDIIDIQLLRTTLVEVNNWLGVDEPTGRVVLIPNNFVFKTKVFNYSHVHPFVWNKVDITVTYETPALDAQALLLKVLEEETATEFGDARKGAAAMETRYGVSETVYQPKIYMFLADSGVMFSLVYCCHYRRNGATRNRINKRIVEEFAKDTRMQLAYPTHREILSREDTGKL
jgi:small-conductance mechanosensitive channel